MNIKELRELLAHHPDDMPVLATNGRYKTDAVSVEVAQIEAPVKFEALVLGVSEKSVLAAGAGK